MRQLLEFIFESSVAERREKRNRRLAEGVTGQAAAS
jgi:hypothetical protein